MYRLIHAVALLLGLSLWLTTGHAEPLIRDKLLGTWATAPTHVPGTFPYEQSQRNTTDRVYFITLEADGRAIVDFGKKDGKTRGRWYYDAHQNTLHLPYLPSITQKIQLNLLSVGPSRLLLTAGGQARMALKRTMRSS